MNKVQLSSKAAVIEAFFFIIKYSQDNITIIIINIQVCVYGQR